jgi:hypothetical protein
MAFAGHAVGDHAGQLDRTVVAQAQHHRAGGLRHGAGVDHGQHRDVEFARQVGRRRVAVVQAHHAFDQHHVRLQRGLRQALAAGLRSDHPQIERMDLFAAGAFEQHRVDESPGRT